MALMFTLLGFLIHEFYFSKEELIQRLYHELHTVEGKLAFRERENTGAQKEIAQTKATVKSLERQLEQRDEQLNLLSSTAARQGEEIRALREESKELRRMSGTLDAHKKPTDLTDLEESRQAPDLAPKDQKIPLWKDILNNILSALEKIDDKVREQNW